jgi:hypothetical protein
MKRTSFGLAAVVAMALPLGMAQAADMAVKAPAPAAVVASDWTGLYFDVGLGWQRDRFNWAYTNLVPAQNPFSLSNGQSSISGHIGYQQQFGWLVVGGEVGAFRSADGKAASVSAPGGAAVAGPCANVGGVVCSASIGSTSLAGGKVGVAWGNWLFYGVGGVAFNSSIATQLATGTSGLVFTDAGAPQSTKGQYWGGGFDYLLLKTNFGDLIGGVEYEHVNLNSVNQCAQTTGVLTGGCAGTAFAAARVVSAREDTVWAKLTLKFNPFAH